MALATLKAGGSTEYYLTDSGTATQIILDDYQGTSANQGCRYTYTDNFSFAPIPVGFIFPPDSELREKFNTVVEELLESGLLDKEFASLEEQVRFNQGS